MNAVTHAQVDDALQRNDYDGAYEAIEDARRIVAHLRSLAYEHTLVTLEEIDFLTRRVDALLRGCLEVL